MGVTERLYYEDSYLTQFHARVVDAADNGRKVYLDRTAFYPASGGQPFDTGTLGARQIQGVIDEGDRIAHVLNEPVSAAEVDGAIDWQRRFDHMQQHTGQHLLSAVLVDLFGITTVSFHLGQEVSTIDVEVAALAPEKIRRAELRANEIVTENRPVTTACQQASEAADLRKPSDREGVLRIVSIDALDRSACGGTHVRATGEIGPILIRKLEKIRGIVRLEFVCGARAVSRARADFDALAEIGRLFSASLDETPALIAAHLEKAQEADKARRRLSIELAGIHGRSDWQAAAPDSAGVRRAARRVAALDDEVRATAQGFTSQSKAVFVGFAENPPAVLLAVSADTGIHAGNLIKQAVSASGGRGGGNATLAQGSVPSKEALDTLLKQLDGAGC